MFLTLILLTTVIAEYESASLLFEPVDPPKNTSSLVFSTDEILTKLNGTINLECGINGTYRYCLWEHMGELFDTLDVHDNVYPGLSKPENFADNNQCGIVIESASAEDHGEWSCKVFIKGETLIGRKNVTILVKPTQPQITPAEINVTADKQTNIVCTVMEARPAVQIKWLLGDDDITEYAQIREAHVTSDGTFSTISSLKIAFTAIDNQKELKCVVDHPAIDKSTVVIAPVSVLFAPLKNIPQLIYFNQSDFFEIMVNFSANPKPSQVLWQYGKSFENLTDEFEIPLENGTIMTKLESLDNGHYTAILIISSLNKDAFQREYNLFVENEIGSTNYQVMLEASIDSEESDHQTVVIIAITSILVLSIIAALICICRSCHKRWTSIINDKPDIETGVLTNLMILLKHI